MLPDHRERLARSSLPVKQQVGVLPVKHLVNKRLRGPLVNMVIVTRAPENPIEGENLVGSKLLRTRLLPLLNKEERPIVNRLPNHICLILHRLDPHKNLNPVHF